MMSRLRYSATRRAKLRGCSTRHRKLKLSSTFLIVPSRVHSEQREAHRADDAAADAVRELHDARGDLGGALLAHRTEELEHDGLEVAVGVEALEHRECEGDAAGPATAAWCRRGPSRAG